MNKFEKSFFSKYIYEWQKIKWILHTHFIDITLKLFLWMLMWAIFPSIMYYNSEMIRNLVPFIFLEGLLIFIFIKVIYDLFDWYNDVWIITNHWVIQLEWSLLKIDTNSVEFNKIEWLEVQQDWIMDKILKKWDILIHKIWDDSFRLYNAINPYKSIDLVEQISNQSVLDSEFHNDKFDIIMDALWWVVENYLDKKTEVTDKEKELNKIISKVENNEWTIDLR